MMSSTACILLVFTCRLHFFGYKQRNSDILNLFRALTDREIRVIVFHGTVARYFNLLLAASRYLFVGPG